MTNRLSPEIVAKYEGTPWIRQHSDGHWIPNYINLSQVTDEVFKDLVGTTRTRPHQAGDARPPISCPEKMQVIVTIDLADNSVIRWWYVDARIQIINEPWFNLNEVFLLPPSHWSPTMKNMYPGAVPSVCIHGD